MKIRKMKINDYESVQKLQQQSYLMHSQERPDIYIQNMNSFNFEYFVEQLNNKNTINLVYEDNDGIVAILLANYKKPSKAPFIRKRKVIFIDSLVVDEFHKKMGIGRRMMEYIENIGKNKFPDSSPAINQSGFIFKSFFKDITSFVLAFLKTSILPIIFVALIHTSFYLF